MDGMAEVPMEKLARVTPSPDQEDLETAIFMGGNGLLADANNSGGTRNEPVVLQLHSGSRRAWLGNVDEMFLRKGVYDCFWLASAPMPAG